ncbi:MAG: hypothetical protein AAB453_00700 [Patescibacteria group bacterium]
MNKEDVPRGRLLGEAGNVAKLAILLKKVAGKRRFTHFDILRGDHYRSGRLLLTEEVKQTSLCQCEKLPASMTALQVADELATEAHSARYTPNPAGDGNMYQSVRGWSITAVKIDGVKAVVVWAAWVNE